MKETDSDFEYLLTVTEGSRLMREKKFDFALLLLDKTDEAIIEMAARIRADEDSFEIFALNTLSDSKIIRALQEDRQFLTYDQLQIKNAVQGVPSQVGNNPILKT